MVTTFALLAAAVLGLMAGALLAEGAVLVPYWRSLPADAFLRWYRQHGGLLLRFFGPLEALALAASASAAMAGWLAEAPGTPLRLAACGLALAVLAAFPLYFQRANASFADGTLAPDRVAGELARWARWHWARVGLAGAAFLAAALALTAPPA